jgi:hypothetical protein
MILANVIYSFIVIATVITIINYNRTVIAIVNYDPETFIVQATSLIFADKVSSSSTLGLANALPASVRGLTFKGFFAY